MRNKDMVEDNGMVVRDSKYNDDKSREIEFMQELDATMEEVIDEVDVNIGRQMEKKMEVGDEFADEINVRSMTYADYSRVFAEVKEVLRQFRCLSKTEKVESVYVIRADINAPLEKINIHHDVTSDDGTCTDDSIVKKMIEMMVRTAIKQLRIQYEEKVILPIRYEITKKNCAISIIRSAWWENTMSAFMNKLREKEMLRYLSAYCFERWIVRTEEANSGKWTTLLRAHNEMRNLERMNASTIQWTEEHEGERRAITRTYHASYDKRADSFVPITNTDIENNSCLETEEDSDYSDNEKRTKRRLKQVSMALQKYSDRSKKRRVPQNTSL